MTGWADRSEQIDALAAAWVAATGELSDIRRTQTANAGQYAYTYATLADALGMARPILAAHGLLVTQTAEATHDEVLVWTTMLHVSGQHVTTQPVRLPAGKTAQNTGSAITYARRYALMAVLGLASEDDDGASAAPRGDRPQARQQPTRPVAVEPRSDDEREIRSIIAALSPGEAKQVREQFKTHFGSTLADLDPASHGAGLEFVREIVAELDAADEAWQADAGGAA